MANPVLLEIKRSGITQSFHRGAAVILGSVFKQPFGSAYWCPHHSSLLATWVRISKPNSVMPIPLGLLSLDR